MKRAILPVITFGLFAMVVADRLSHALASGSANRVVEAPGEVPGDPANGDTIESDSLGGDVPDVSAGPVMVSTIDRLARLAIRKQLSREAGATYLDSLVLNTDSVLRRWPDRRTPLRVTMIEGGPAGYRPQMAGFARDAMDQWEALGLGVHFEPASDSADADIVVRWIDRFDFDRAGQTDLTWDQVGRVRRASITLALRTNTGITLPDAALRTVALHETGHALGLPHSADSNDVMFPSATTKSLSERDRRSAQLLYQLPPGPLRDPAEMP